MSSNLVCLCAAVSSLLLLLLLPANQLVSAAGRYDAIFSFGDSYADTGNNPVVFAANGRVDLAARPPFGSTFFARPTGRCSDGRLVVDFIAQRLGLPLVPPSQARDGSFRQGANFAVSGATALDAEFFRRRQLPGGMPPPLNTSLAVQLEWFEALKPSLCSTTQECEEFFGRSLFIVGEFGINDYTFFIEKNTSEITPFVSDVIGTISMAVERLIKHGATSLVIAGMIPLGCFRKILTGTDGCIQEYNELGMRHNLLLQEALEKLRARHPNTTIVYADLFRPIMDMVESPTKFGFEGDDVFTACCGGPGPGMPFCGADGANVCENPSARLIWDGIHLTEAAYRYIAHRWLRSIDDAIATGGTYSS